MPDGYLTYRTPTFTNVVGLRADGGVPAMKQTRIYRLAQAEDPEANEFINISDVAINTVHANDFTQPYLAA